MDKIKRSAIPHTYTLIMIFILISTALTYLIPAGIYDLVPGGRMIDPTSFHMVEKSPVGIVEFLLSVPTGLKKSAEVIFQVFMVGGFFQVINDTKSLDLAIGTTIDKLEKKALMVIPVVMVIMYILGLLGVVVNSSIAFIPIGVAVAKKLKLDPVVGAAMMYLGAYAGFATTPMGPFNTLIAQSIAGLEPMSGFGLRMVVSIAILISTIIYVYRYAKRVETDNKKSVLDNIDWEVDSTKEEKGEFKVKHMIVFIIMTIGFAIYVYGSYEYKWGMSHLSGVMMVMAILSGLVSGSHPDDMSKSFIKGAQSMVYGALIIGFARAITIVLTDGNVIHTIIHYITIPLMYLPSTISAVGMFFANLLFNFIVPSGSGQAMIVMPLMTPMAEVVNVSKQIAVSAYQYGDGFSNIIIPTSGVLMAVLGVAKIPYEKWLKFVTPIFLIWVIIGSISIVVGVAINWT
ncbi:hypothetical protein [Psychrilyobacter sp.]|uniref:YfcC family protein n=1 Tax=Psychrilyobacter sp. TaxID=2586924 RepID=UPI00301B6854